MTIRLNSSLAKRRFRKGRHGFQFMIPLPLWFMTDLEFVTNSLLIGNLFTSPTKTTAGPLAP